MAHPSRSSAWPTLHNINTELGVAHMKFRLDALIRAHLKNNPLTVVDFYSFLL